MKKMYDIIISIILALGLIISVAIFSNAVDNINKKNHIVIVKGTSSITRPIKEYKFSVIIETSAKDIDATYNNLYTLEDRLASNVEYKYEKDSMDLENIKKIDGKSIIGYKVKANYTFKSNKLDEIKKMREEVNKITAQYVDMDLSDIEVIYGNVNEEALINQAIKNAKNKAYNIVKENSKQLGDVIKIKQDRISTNDDKSSVNVTVTYEIN